MIVMTKHFPSPFTLTVAVLSAAMLLGGGQGHLGDTLTQLLALALLASLFWRYPKRHDWPKVALLALFPALAVMSYLLPLPEALIQAGSARQAVLTTSQAITEPAWQAGLIAVASERALFWLLPALSIYLAGLQFSQRQRQRLVLVVIFWVFIGSVIGLAQKAFGEESLLYFFNNTNRGSSVGFFANSNHYAIAMAASLPLVWAGLMWLINHRTQYRIHPLWFLLFCGIAMMFVLGFMLSDSRAGLVLGILGCFLMLPAIIAADRHHGSKRWLFAFLAIGSFIFFLISLYFIRLQFQESPLDDLRWKFAPIVQDAARDFAPMGSSPGSFWFVFPRYEAFMSGNIIVNHAHNDYLELWLEMRWLFAAAALPLLAAYLLQGYKLWFKAADIAVHTKLLARAAWIGLLILMIHSLVDYPLRTTAISAFAGLLAALLVIPASARIEVQEA
jgi:hypothetical protein